MLDEILTKVGTAIQGDWKRTVDPDVSPTVEITQDAVNYQQDAPRVVFECMGERWVRQNVASRDGKTQPRLLFTRLCNIRTHVWGEDRTRTELLLRAVARQSYALLYGSYEPTSGQWVNSSSTKRGLIYLFDAVYQLPVPREEDASVPLDGLPITPDLHIPGSI